MVNIGNDIQIPLTQYSTKELKRQKSKAIVCFILFLVSFSAHIKAQQPNDTISCDSSLYHSKTAFIHQISAEIRPGTVFQTNNFLKGNTPGGTRHDFCYSAHLRYAVQYKPNTLIDRIFQGVYQGVGLNYYDFGDSKLMGNPYSAYLFQGARITNLSPRVSFNYEWNLGLSWNWKHYDVNTNPDNVTIGSALNAYINASFFLKWILNRHFDLTTGIDLTHFSNGNTQIPNAGLNLVDFKLGLTYLFNRKEDKTARYTTPLPPFRNHITYDFLCFGSWRRKGVVFNGSKIASPYKYNVWGVSFAPMYNVCYRFRTGLSLDGVYDASANVEAKEGSDDSEEAKPRFTSPKVSDQMALGLSARTEYVMPFFAINIGIGVNVLHPKGDMKSVYEMLSLKAELTRHLYLHIGYKLQNFHIPNYLMLGIGIRINNPTSRIYK